MNECVREKRREAGEAEERRQQQVGSVGQGEMRQPEEETGLT